MADQPPTVDYEPRHSRDVGPRTSSAPYWKLLLFIGPILGTIALGEWFYHGPGEGAGVAILCTHVLNLTTFVVCVTAVAFRRSEWLVVDALGLVWSTLYFIAWFMFT